MLAMHARKANTQVWYAQDPYVKALLPGQTEGKTGTVLGGGTEPIWSTLLDSNSITLQLAVNSLPCTIRLEIWNENKSFLERDDFIASTEIRVNVQQLQAGVSTVVMCNVLQVFTQIFLLNNMQQIYASLQARQGIQLT
jgi:hypothetical protein